MNLLSHEDLDAARRLGDPVADSAILDLGNDIWVLNASLRHIHRNDDPIPSTIPESVRSLFDDEAAIPPWLDRERVRRAQRWASARLVPITVALFCSSLPTAYSAARGARVLAATGRMQGKNLERRVNETAQFVLDVLAEDGFEPNGRAIRSIQKVRLMHAAVRAHVAHVGGGDGEIPINQEDLLGTLFTFSIVVLKALRMLGIAVSDEEAEDYYHLWRGVGVMMGIRADLLPEHSCDASTLGARIFVRQRASSEHGRALMAALLEGMEQHVPRFPSVPTYLVRYLAGDAVADDLGVPTIEAFSEKLVLLRFLPRVPSSLFSGLPVHLSAVLGRPLLSAVINAKLGAESASFSMPIARQPVHAPSTHLPPQEPGPVPPH